MRSNLITYGKTGTPGDGFARRASGDGTAHHAPVSVSPLTAPPSVTADEHPCSACSVPRRSLR